MPHKNKEKTGTKETPSSFKRTFLYDESHLSGTEIDQRRRLIERSFNESGAPVRHRESWEFKGQKWIDTLEQIYIGHGSIYVFVGTRGAGKTQMAIELLWIACNWFSLGHSGYSYTNKNIPVRYIKLTDLCMDIKATVS